MNRAMSAPATSHIRTSSQCDVGEVLASDDTSVTNSSNEGKTVNHFDSKELILQFTKMNVSPLQHQAKVESSSSSASTATASEITTSTTRRVIKHWRFKTKHQNRPTKIFLRPSKLNMKRNDPESLFRDFSVACSKELDSIASSDLFETRDSCKKKKKSKKDSSKVDADAMLQRRKASSCAEQARQLSNDELSDAIDILADFLEESVVFPKKMSYMAELMYT